MNVIVFNLLRRAFIFTRCSVAVLDEYTKTWNDFRPAAVSALETHFGTLTSLNVDR